MFRLVCEEHRDLGQVLEQHQYPQSGVLRESFRLILRKHAKRYIL